MLMNKPCFKNLKNHFFPCFRQFFWCFGAIYYQFFGQEKSISNPDPSDKITTPGSHVVSFHALKNLNTPSRPKPWQPSDLFTGVEESAALEQMADFFNKLSVEFSDLESVLERYEVQPIRMQDRCTWSMRIVAYSDTAN